jgi:hypothetical protein
VNAEDFPPAHPQTVLQRVCCTDKLLAHIGVAPGEGSYCFPLAGGAPHGFEKIYASPEGTSHSQRYTSGSRALTASYGELAFERTGLWPSARNQRALAILAGLIRVAARLADAAPRKGEPSEAEQNHRPGGGLRRGDEVHVVRRVEPGQQRRLDVASVRIHQRHFVEAADRDDRCVGIEPAEPDLIDKVRVRFGDMEPARCRFREDHVVDPLDIASRVRHPDTGHSLVFGPRCAISLNSPARSQQPGPLPSVVSTSSPLGVLLRLSMSGSLANEVVPVC